MRQLTAEDYARIAADARAVRDRALGLTPAVQEATQATGAERKRRRKQQARATRSDAGKPKPRGPVFDRAQIAALYRDGLSVSEVAQRMGCNRGTVTRALKELGIEQTRKGGPPRLEKCMRGHDFTDVYLNKNGARACRPCAQERRKKTD